MVVVTRKRGCSATEATETTETTPSTRPTRAAKLSKQDEGVESPATRNTPRGAASSGTPSISRRSRRVTDPVTEAIPSIPNPPQVKESNTESEPKTSENETQGESSSNTKANVAPLLSIQKKLIVKLNDIVTVTPQSPRRRRVSGGGEKDTPTVSTPVRRSRRLSGSGVEDESSQETPSKKLTVTRLLGYDEKPKEETASKSNVLPVIEEEKGSPKKDTREEEQKQKIDSALPTITEVETKDEVLSDPIPVTKKDDETKTVVDQPVANEGDVKDVPVEGTKEDEVMDTQDMGSTSNITEIESSIANLIKSEGERETIIDSKEQEIETTEAAESNDSQESKTKEDKNAKLDTKEPEVVESNNNQENKTETTKDPESNNIQENTQTDEACGVESNHIQENTETFLNDTDTASNTPDEKSNCVSALPPIVVGDKQPTKVIPDVEKMEQLRSIPKGRSISGKWWKKEKQR